MSVKGFRCHSSTTISIESPITAFCGLNGTGKSTILHLAAVAYKRQDDVRKYIGDYIVTGTLDPSPFTNDASIEYGYWQDDRTIEKVTIKRDQPGSRWRGYKARPARSIYFAGIGLYLPKIEVPNFLLRNSSKLTVTASTELGNDPKKWIQRILNGSYESVIQNEVKHASRTGEVVTVNRDGCTYSEANMGCGEGRVQHLVQALEALPNKSLILLEEPETSLHQSAEYLLGEYLIDVCIRKGHQVLMTTHSESLMRSLPSQSRIFLYRDATGRVRPIGGITTSQAISLMTAGKDKAITILVEDDVAKTVLVELVRKVDPMLLPTIEIHIGGSANTIKSAMDTVRDSGINVIAVRDGDQPEITKDNLFKLPGTRPPEKEIFTSDAVRQHVEANYGHRLTDFEAAHGHRDHHEWFALLGATLVVEEPALVQEMSRVYVQSLGENVRDALVAIIKQSIR
jgi:predicted ATPase